MTLVRCREDNSCGVRRILAAFCVRLMALITQSGFESPEWHGI